MGIIYTTLLESSSATLVKHPGSHTIPSRKHAVVRELKFTTQVAIKQSAANYCSRQTGFGKCGLYCAGVQLWGTVQEAKECCTVSPKWECRGVNPFTCSPGLGQKPVQHFKIPQRPWSAQADESPGGRLCNQNWRPSYFKMRTYTQGFNTL